jgi:hypothetical protein
MLAVSLWGWGGVGCGFVTGIDRDVPFEIQLRATT